MKDLELDNLSPAQYAELRRLVNACHRATTRRYKCEEGCREAFARLATKRAELATSEQEEEQALARLNRFLANHRQQPQHTQRQKVANSWATRCETEAQEDQERARRERFTKMG